MFLVGTKRFIHNVDEESEEEKRKENKPCG